MLDESVFKLLLKSITSFTGINLELEKIIQNSIETPPSLEFGERSTNIAFKLAKILRQSPTEIAQGVSDKINTFLSSTDFVRKTEATKGYINFFINFPKLFQEISELIQQEGKNFGKNSLGTGQKIVIEHTSINPVKALHIGNLRNAILGDIIARLYEWNGWEVEVQNLIDDLGRQVATLVWGLLNGVQLDVNRDTLESFDVWLGKVYSRCNSILEENNAWDQVEKIMVDMRKEPMIYRFMREVCQACVDSNLETAWRHGISYDYLVWESDISRSGIWEETLQLLEKSESFSWEKEGPNKGCFVANLGDLPEFEDKKNPQKIFIRSNGVPTYVAHDVALQFWKFGLVKASLKSRAITKQKNESLEVKDLWSSTDLQLPEVLSREFGNADRVCNVIGVEQAYLQDIVRHSLKLLKLDEQYQNTFHLSYKHVSAPHARFSGRTGNWYEERAWADAVLQDTYDGAFKVITLKRPDLDQELTKKREITKNIAVGAIRYWLAKFSTETEVKFRIEDATSLEGDTGPFLMYAHVRATKILEKLGEKSIKTKYQINEAEITTQEKQLILELYRFPDVIISAASSFQPIQVTKYAFELASAFNKFYETSPVISAKSSDIQGFRVDLVRTFRIVMGNVLQVLGIPIVDEM
ncbi:MAG: arginine--tRNA ligase [Candidatus Hodarchaeota archaeon]